MRHVADTYADAMAPCRYARFCRCLCYYDYATIRCHTYYATLADVAAMLLMLPYITPDAAADAPLRYAMMLLLLPPAAIDACAFRAAAYAYAATRIIRLR